jgi:hypothetical protein
MDLRFHPRTEAQKELRFVPRPRGCGWPGHTSVPPEADAFWGLPRRTPARARGKMLLFSQFYGGYGEVVMPIAHDSPTGRLPTGIAFIDGVSVGTAVGYLTSTMHSPQWDVRGLQASVKKLWKEFVYEYEETESPEPNVEWDEGPGHILD